MKHKWFREKYKHNLCTHTALWRVPQMDAEGVMRFLLNANLSGKRTERKLNYVVFSLEPLVQSTTAYYIAHKQERMRKNVPTD